MFVTDRIHGSAASSFVHYSILQKMATSNVKDDAFAATYSEPSNGVRSIYTISEHEPKNTTGAFAKLINGLYFYKVARSDELMRYTETDVRTIIRVILFVYVFSISPNESIIELINTGTFSRWIEEEDIDQIVCQELTLEIASYILDATLGENFSTVAKHSVALVFEEYMLRWRYFQTGYSVNAPSADDYIRVFRFVNVPLATYTPATRFVNTNTHDHRILLQGTVKSLDCDSDVRKTGRMLT